jgi:hypothetical protein
MAKLTIEAEGRSLQIVANTIAELESIVGTLEPDGSLPPHPPAGCSIRYETPHKTVELATYGGGNMGFSIKHPFFPIPPMSKTPREGWKTGGITSGEPEDCAAYASMARALLKGTL